MFIVNFDHDQIPFTNKFDNCKFVATIKEVKFNIGDNLSPLKTNSLMQHKYAMYVIAEQIIVSTWHMSTSIKMIM